jgi:hypothetical protein
VNPDLHRDFCTAYCEHYQIPREAFQKALWAQSAYIHTRIFQKLLQVLQVLHAEFFEPEEFLLKRVGNCRDVKAIQDEIDLYHGRVVDRSFLKKHFRLRIRCRTLTRLGSQWLPNRLYSSV